jgi:hypothetical protein
VIARPKGLYARDTRSGQRRHGSARRRLAEFNGYVLASTWLQCGPAAGIHGPFSVPGGRSKLGSDKDERAAWNTDIDAIQSDAGILRWLEFIRDTYGRNGPSV